MKILKAFNKSRWNKEPGFFEVWYLTFNNRKTLDGFWIRFTLVVPKNVLESPFLNLWFTGFREEKIISAISQNYKISECEFSDEMIKIKDSYLTEGETRGEITSTSNKIFWDLRFTDGGEFLHLPSQIYNMPVLHSYIVSPNLSFEINGKINIDGEEIEIDGIGTQSHIWGKEMPDSWIWAHTDSFESHKGVFELLSAETTYGPIGKISASRIYLRFEDEEFSFFTLKNLAFKECSLFPEYMFFATGKRYKIEGKLFADKGSFAQYNYPMPSNKEVFCLNTECGSINIVVYKRESIFKPFVYYTVLKNIGLTHFEFGLGHKNEDIPLLNPH
ncbi:MAG: hypothetical protein ACP5QK_02810 [Myxococcota bacterium]